MKAGSGILSLLVFITDITYIIAGPMDYPKNIVKLNNMVEEYVNSSVIMYGLVANWIPLFKFYVNLKKSFGMEMNVTEGNSRSVIPIQPLWPFRTNRCGNSESALMVIPNRLL